MTTLFSPRFNSMKTVSLSQLRDNLSKYLHLSENEQVIVTWHGRSAGILVGFASEDEWFEYQLENDPRFLKRIEQARASLRNGHGVRLEDAASANKPRSKR